MNILNLIWQLIITTFEGVGIKPCAFAASALNGGLLHAPVLQSSRKYRRVGQKISLHDV